MKLASRHPRMTILIGVVMLLLVVASGYATLLASEANMLPWQAEPTRIAVEPFSGIPGFDNAMATPTID